MSMKVFTFKHRTKVEQDFRTNGYVKLLGLAPFRSIRDREFCGESWRVEGVGPDQGVPREISGRRGLIKDETSVIHWIEVDGLWNEASLKWEAMAEDLGVEAGGSEEGDFSQ